MLITSLVSCYCPVCVSVILGWDGPHRTNLISTIDWPMGIVSSSFALLISWRCQGNGMNWLCHDDDYYWEGFMNTASTFIQDMSSMVWQSPFLFLYPTQRGSLCSLTKEPRSQHLWRWWRLRPPGWQKTLPIPKLPPRWRSPPWTARGRRPGLTSWSTATWTCWLPRVSEPLVPPQPHRCCLPHVVVLAASSSSALSTLVLSCCAHTHAL